MEEINYVINQTKQGVYFVLENETLKDVAVKFNTTEKLLIIQNSLTDQNVIGKALFVKSYEKVYTVNLNETLKNICEKFAVLPEVIQKINCIKDVYPGLRIILEDE